MKPLDQLEPWRDRFWEAAGGSAGDRSHACFRVISEDGGAELCVIASITSGWDHVSVSVNSRCPTWGEMEQVKRLFFRDDETAMQLHVPGEQHVNFHPYCLHLWRPRWGKAIPRPPREMVL